MNNHEDIRKLLSPYCGGDLNAAERGRVEEHLAACTACRAELADLQTAVKLIRTTPEVEPPPWLTSRIMARLREEQRTKRSWLQRLFFPLQIKLPLEALAVLVVCVSGYYLSRTADPEMTRAVPQLNQPAAPQAVHQPAAGTEKEQPVASPPEPAKHREMPQHAAERQAPAPASSVPAATPAFAPAPASVKEEQLAPAAGASVESKNSASRVAVSDKSQESTAKMKKAAPARDMQRRESVAPLQAERSLSAGAPDAAAYPQVAVRLNLADVVAANESIRKALALSGGTIVEADQALVERKLKARIFAERLSGLMDRLGHLGRIVQQPTASNFTGIVEITIEW